MNRFFKNISIELDRNVYYSNDYINGRLRFNITNRIFINTLRVRLIGYCKINWNKTGSLKGKYKKLENNYTAMETYIERELAILSKDQDEDLILELGPHSYSFQFLLKNHLPASFENPCGRICYKVVCEIDQLMYKIEHLSEKQFTVLNTLDLNLYRNLKELNSIKINKQTKKCFVLKNKGNIEITLNTLQAGYVPGQSLPFGLVIKNESSSDIKKFYVYLIQQTKIQTNSNFRIASVYKLDRIVKKKTTEIIRNSMIKVPPLCPTFEENLIKVTYFLMVSFNSSEKKKLRNIDSSYMTIPITIGTKPFAEDEYYYKLIEFRRCIFGKNDQIKDFKLTPKKIEYTDFRPFYHYYDK